MSSPGAGRLILIVEDNDKNVKLTRDILRFHGFRIIEAASGEDGVALAAEKLPDLILMDIVLPGLDGVEATRQLKAEKATRDIPIVAITASVMRSHQDRITHAGFAGLIAKPIDVRTFVEQILAFCGLSVPS